MIGTHSVIFNADPSADKTWNPAFNPNPEFATDAAGWWPGNALQSWTWTGGQLVGNLPANGPAVLATFVYPSNVAVPAGAQLFRLTVQIDVKSAHTTDLRLRLGYSRFPGNSWEVYHETVILNPKTGIQTIELISDPATLGMTGTYTLRPEIRLQASTSTPSSQWAQSCNIEYFRLQAATAAQLTTDLSCFVDEISIHHGRDDTDTQPDASAATLDLSTDTSVEDWPPSLEIGGFITVTTTIGQSAITRFKGRVTDISVGWDDAFESTPHASIMQIIATGPLADLGRRVVGDAPWGQELDGARVSRIMAAAGVTLNPATSDPGTVQILARDVDAQPALDLAQAVAVDAGGLVWEMRTGEIRYADADHRRGTTAALEMDACDVLVTPTWRRTTEGLVNDVSIGYGPTPDGGEQPRYAADRPDSIKRYGEYGISAATQLAALADATAMGQLLLTRNSSPVWVLGALPVSMADLSPDETTALLSLDMSDLVRVFGMPSAGSVPTSGFLWVEGWSERLAFGIHEYEMVVSGYCRTSPPPRWDDVNPASTWDSMGAVTWDDAACFGPPETFGRWNDVPAANRWDTTAPAVTWDSWTG